MPEGLICEATANGMSSCSGRSCRAASCSVNQSDLIGSLSEEGLNALPTQWGFAEAAAEHGQTVHLKDWRVRMSWHIAETREQARAEARDGLLRHHNEYILGREGDALDVSEADDAADEVLDVFAGRIMVPDVEEHAWASLGRQRSRSSQKT
jgi:hypothetical protein